MGSIRRQLPNCLSVLRVILLVPFVIAINHNSPWELLVISAAIILTDYLDGFLARAWNTVSPAGKILDPVADKICFAVVAVALIFFRGFPAWLFWAIVVRDALILAAGLLLIRLRHFVPVSDVAGKVSTVITAASMTVFLFDIAPLKATAVSLTIAVLIVSFLSYARFFWVSLAGHGR